MFKFDESNRLKAAGTGKDFKDFKGSFSNEDRGFGYIRINVRSYRPKIQHIMDRVRLV